MKLTEYIKRSVVEVVDSNYINHRGCSAGDDTRKRLWLKRTKLGVMCYCHNCGEKLFVKDNYTKSLFESNVEHVKNEILLDYTKNISKDGLLWLFKYDLSLKEIEDYSIGYSPNLDRVILPIVTNGRWDYWQARALSPGVYPKYLNPKFMKSPFYSQTEDLGNLVIVEDIISAIKVGRCMRACAILGSKIPEEVYKVARRCKKVYLWLDPDMKDKMNNIKTNLSMYTEITIVDSDKDPKEYSTDKIKVKLGLV